MPANVKTIPVAVLVQLLAYLNAVAATPIVSSMATGNANACPSSCNIASLNMCNVLKDVKNAASLSLDCPTGVSMTDFQNQMNTCMNALMNVNMMPTGSTITTGNSGSGNAVTITVPGTSMGGITVPGAGSGNPATIGTLSQGSGSMTPALGSGNTVTVNPGTGSDMPGSSSQGSGSMNPGLGSGNTVTVNPGAGSGSTRPGASSQGLGSGNTVTVNPGAGSGSTMPGASSQGLGSGNTVTVTPGTGSSMPGSSSQGSGSMNPGLGSGNTVSVHPGSGSGNTMPGSSSQGSSAGPGNPSGGQYDPECDCIVNMITSGVAGVTKMLEA